MVTLARQESNWTDCSDAVIACSSRQCSTVCQNGPNAGKACTTGTSHVCQGGTERDGTFCTKANPSECGQMREGMCEWECRAGDCPEGYMCKGEPGECQSEEAYCDRYAEKSPTSLAKEP